MCRCSPDFYGSPWIDSVALRGDNGVVWYARVVSLVSFYATADPQTRIDGAYIEWYSSADTEDTWPDGQGLSQEVIDNAAQAERDLEMTILFKPKLPYDIVPVTAIISAVHVVCFPKYVLGHKAYVVNKWAKAFTGVPI
jgi:hypothetical protein